MTGEAPHISAVIPSYNHGRYLAGAIESVLAQEPGVPFEVVIVDDGSKDDSREVIRRYEQDPRVRVEARQNQGISATFTRGLELARGEWVGYCCSDDRWGKDHLKRALDALAQAPAANVVFGRARVIDGEGQVMPDAQVFGELSGPDPLPQLLRTGNSFCFIAAVFRRALALERGGFDRQVGVLQDFDLWLDLLSRGPPAYVLEPTVDFRWDGNNASGPKATVQKRRDLIRVLTRALELPRVKDDAELRAAVLDRMRESHLRLARRLTDRAERRAHLREARRLGTGAWRHAIEWLKTLGPAGR